MQRRQLLIPGNAFLAGVVFRRLAQIVAQQLKNFHTGQGRYAPLAVGRLDLLGNAGLHARLFLQAHLEGVHTVGGINAHLPAEHVVVRGRDHGRRNAESGKLLHRAGTTVKGVSHIQLRCDRIAALVVVLAGGPNLRHGAVNAPIAQRIDEARQQMAPAQVLALSGETVRHLLDLAILHQHVLLGYMAQSVMNKCVFQQHLPHPFQPLHSS